MVSADTRIVIDIESFSACDIQKEGGYKYAHHPSTQIVCMAYGYWNGNNAEVFLWREGEPFPVGLRKAIEQDHLLVAHNAGFEFEMLNGPAGQKIGCPQTPPIQWIDTAARAAALGLPRSLEKAGAALGLDVQKDKKGHAIMLKLCRPRRKSQDNPSIRWTPETKPQDFQALYDYCVRDVETTIHLDERMPDLSWEEHVVWMKDLEINRRGFLVDLKTVERIKVVRSRIIWDLEEECVSLTGYNSSQRAEMLGWMQGRGVELEDYQKGTLADALKCEYLPADVRRVMEIRLETGKISTKKFDSLQRATASDGRLRGTYLYHGAQTGRWSGRIFQPQNIARGTVNADIAIQAINTLPYEVFTSLYAQPMEALSSMLRGMIWAPDGHELVVCDYSSIEARVVQWLAADEKALDIFRKGNDPYKDMACSIFNVEYDDVTKDQRFVGKIAILGLGYAMGASKFYDTCLAWGATFVTEELADRTVEAFRSKYRRLTLLWKVIQNAAIEAIRIPEDPVKAGKHIQWVYEPPFLHMILPSGRKISYYDPEVVTETVHWQGGTFTAPTIRYKGVDTQTRVFGPTSTYGGKLVENATQAVARDVLAEAILRLERRRHKVVMHVHDEIVVESPVGQLTAEKMESIMCELPAWGGGLPIGAEGFTCKRYKK